MNARRLVYLDRAIKDFDGIADYIEERVDSSFARDFIERLQARCRAIAAIPGSFGQARYDLMFGMRSTPHGNYIIFFRYVDDRCEVIRVRHAARDLATFDEA